MADTGFVKGKAPMSLDICGLALQRNDDETVERWILELICSPWWSGENETRGYPGRNGCGIGEFIIE